jgi:lambda family phage portal protein
MWAEDPRASVEGDANWYEMQRKIALSQTISGDIFTLLVRKPRRNWPFQTALQLIEADRVCNQDNKANGDGLFEGIQRAKKDGEILAIWVAKYHPGRRILTPAQQWDKIPIYGNLGRRNVLHRKQTRRPGETRGMPVISVITGIIKQFTRYTEAEIEAAVNAAAQVLLAEMDPDSFKDLYNPDEQKAWRDGVTEARSNTTGLESGRILNLLPGEKVTTPTPGRPNPNFGPFVKNFYTLLGMGLTMPPETLTGLYESSYTAARASLQQLHQTINIQRQDDVTHTCQPGYETWLGDCVADGIIACPGFFDNVFVRHGWCNATWTGTGQASLNPLDEAKAAEIRARFLTSEAEEAQNYDGGDYEERHLQRVKEARKRREDGLPPLGATDASPDPLAIGDTIAQ